MLDRPSTTTGRILIVGELSGATGFLETSSKDWVRHVREGEAASPEVAAALAAEQPFGVAFVDLPWSAGIDGVETAARMWRIQPDLEVVLCTGRTDVSLGALQERLPMMRDQLVIQRTPIDPVELRQLVASLSEKWLRGRGLQRMEKFDVLGQLTAGIAHEINTPIQYIRSNLEFLGDTFAAIEVALAALRAKGGDVTAIEALVAEVPVAVADALDGVRRVQGIVRGIRDYAHPSRHHREPMDVNRQIRAVVELARHEYRYDADVELQLGELPMVPGHADELGCAILNLVVNAAQAIHAARAGQGPRATITITSRATADAIAIDVADTGPGISAAHRARVFEPFFTTKPIGQGTGQGLTIARAIVVERHHGTLTFESEPGRGTTFQIRLPIQRGVAS